MPHGENEYRVVRFLVAVQSKVAGSATRYDQFPHVLLRRRPYQRVIFEYLQCFQNQFSRFQGCNGICFKEEIGETFKVGERPPGINQSRQDLAFGLEAALPFSRART